MSQATGIAASTIGRGLRELTAEDQLAPDRIRRPGGGSKTLVAKDPTLLPDLLALVEPDARGDPMSPLRWTCKSLRNWRRLGGEGPQDRPHGGCELLHEQEIQPASQSQDPRRGPASRIATRNSSTSNER